MRGLLNQQVSDYPSATVPFLRASGRCLQAKVRVAEPIPLFDRYLVVASFVKAARSFSSACRGSPEGRSAATHHFQLTTFNKGDRNAL